MSADAAAEPEAGSRFVLGLVLWLAGMLGVLAFALLPLPRQLVDQPLRIPLWLIQAIGLVQSALTLAVAVALGTRLAPRVGLRAPVFEALVARRSALRALLPQLVPGLAGGLLGAGVLLLFARRAPAEIDSVAASGFDPSLLVRVLYGGITEELLLRWGAMTVVLWLLARLVRARDAAPGLVLVTIAVLISSLLFGLGHLPTVVAFGGDLTRGVLLYVLGGNALFGIVVGVLFWRYGLEAAMLAHALAHVFMSAL